MVLLQRKLYIEMDHLNDLLLPFLVSLVNLGIGNVNPMVCEKIAQHGICACSLSIPNLSYAHGAGCMTPTCVMRCALIPGSHIVSTIHIIAMKIHMSDILQASPSRVGMAVPDLYACVMYSSEMAAYMYQRSLRACRLSQARC